MPSDVTGDEFKQLATRVDVVEREVDGEKLVTRHILEHCRRNTEDLARLQTNVKGLQVDVKGLQVDVKGLQADVKTLDRKIDRVEAKVDGLAKSLPTIVGDEMRKVMREQQKP